MFTLTVVQGRASSAAYSLEAPRISIGHGPGNQVQVEGDRIPSEAGQIFQEGEQYFYQEYSSSAASRIVRGRECVAIGLGPTLLRDGDLISLGDEASPVTLRFQAGEGDPDGSGSHPAEGAQGEGPLLARRPIDELPQVVAAELARDPQKFQALYEVSRKLGRRGLDLQSTFEGIAEAVFELVPRVTHVSIDLGGDDGRMSTVFVRARDGRRAEGEPVRTSRTVVRRVARERAALWVGDVQQEMNDQVSKETRGMELQSVLAVPLWDGETIRGVLQADNRGSSQPLLRSALDALLLIAAQATLAIENARLAQRLKIAEEKARGENTYLKNREERRRSGNIVGASPSMEHIFAQIDKVKDTRATVCIEGETGTGKELIASAIHAQGNRKDKLFVAQNCAAVPDNLLESELFGHKRGAFTGADHDKKGLFEIADLGTLFLDEIGEMSLGLQAKLLRVLQEGEVRPVGATQSKKVDVRIICATNRSLEKEVERGGFRQDLYYRLKVFPIHLPALRERREDIPRLVDHFIDKYRSEMKKDVAGMTPETIDQLAAYQWPGNIRELENEIQRLVIQVDPGGYITPDLLSPQIRKVEGLLGRVAPQGVRKKGTLKDMMEEVERWLLTEALREHGGNKTKTAETLGITREGLHKKLGKYGM